MLKQGKWETIISLLVQEPKQKIIFFRKDLDWSEVHGNNMGIDWIAKIPSHIIPEFIIGVEINPEAPCYFIRVQNKCPCSRPAASV